jgi:hypothetical protein
VWSEEAGHNNPILLLSTEFSYILNLLWPTFFFIATNLEFTLCQCCWSQPIMPACIQACEWKKPYLASVLFTTDLTYKFGEFPINSSIHFWSHAQLLCFFQVHNSFYHVTDPLSSGGKFLAQTSMASYNSTNASHKLTHENWSIQFFTAINGDDKYSVNCSSLSKQVWLLLLPIHLGVHTPLVTPVLHSPWDRKKHWK